MSGFLVVNTAGWRASDVGDAIPRTSSYLLTHYLPIVGPSCLAAVLWAQHVLGGSLGAAVELPDVAAFGEQIGVPGAGRALKVVERLEHQRLGILIHTGGDVVGVGIHLYVPPLTRRQQNHLPTTPADGLVVQHQQGATA